MCGLDDGVLMDILERAVGPEKAPVAFDAFSLPPSVSIRYNPFKCSSFERTQSTPLHPQGGLRGVPLRLPESLHSISPSWTKNGAGGINGGITNGAPIVFRVAFKPTSSIRKEQETMNMKTGETVSLVIPGRHDICFALRTPVIVEAVAAIVLADLQDH